MVGNTKESSKINMKESMEIFDNTEAHAQLPNLMMIRYIFCSNKKEQCNRTISTNVKFIIIVNNIQKNNYLHVFSNLNLV